MSQNRIGYIGGSDIAAVMGLSRWKSPLQLWAEKTGTIVDDREESEASELGRELEDFVARKFGRKTGLKVRKAPQIYKHKQYDFFRCQVDRLITGTDELLEVKTANQYKLKEWSGDDIPQEYILQVMWQLGITGRNKGWIAVLIGGQKFLYKEIVFDNELFNKMVEQALIFWQCVQDKIPPLACGIDNPFIIELNPTHDDNIKEAQEEMDTKIGLLQETKFHIDQLIQTKDELEAQIKQVIGSALGIKTSKYVVTWKEQISKRLDNDKLKADGLYDKYLKQGSTRVLRVKLEKEKQNV